MIIGSIQQLTRKDIPESPEWVDTLLKPINSSMKNLSDCLRKRVNFAENIDGDVKTLRVSHGIPFETTVNVKNRVIGCSLIACPRRAENPVFERAGDKIARITIFFLPGDPGEEIEVTMAFYGG